VVLAAVIYNVGINENIRRGDRVLMQINVFVTMLNIVLFSYWLKSSQCADQLVEHLACPSLEACMGYVGCFV
jgi:hypothetical protein